MSLALLRIRGQARTLAKATLQRELDALRTLGLDLGEQLPAATNERDRQRAIAYGRGHAQRVARAGDDWITSTDYALERLAVTEVSEAHNAERIRRLERIEHTETAGGLVVFKVWDAARDKRMCPVCERADGTVRPPGLDFPEGMPGGVHPFCRCYCGLLLLPVTYDYSVNYSEAA